MRQLLNKQKAGQVRRAKQVKQVKQIKRVKAFTLIELLVVISIIGLLASIIMVALKGAKSKAKIAAGLQFEAEVNHALGAYTVGSWDFDEGKGTTAKDSSGNGNNGTIHGASWRCASSNKDYTPSGKGCSLYFYNNYVQIPNSSSLTNPKQITMAAWVYPLSYRYYGNIISKRYPAQYILRFYSTTGRIQGYVYVNGWRVCTTPSGQEAPLKKWTYLVHTYNGKTGRVYINGKVACTYSYTGTINSGTAPIRIGLYSPGSEYFYGYIDDARIYEQALSSAQIQQLYARGLKEHPIAKE